MMIPQHTYSEATTLSCIVYTLVGVSRQKTSCGTDSVAASNFQLDCYAINDKTAKQLARAVRVELLDYAGLMGETVVKDVRLDTEFDLLDPEPGLYRVSQSYTIWHVE